LKGNTLITGRQIVDKAKLALNEAKKLLGYWMEFLVNGQMPSGKNEDDALQYVLDRAYQETSVEHDDDNDSIAGSDGENTLNTEIAQNEDVEAEIEEEKERETSDSGSDCDGDNADEMNGMSRRQEKESNGGVRENRAPPNFFPPAMLLFIMYGPYGVSVFNLELSSGLTVDTRAIEEIAGNKMLNTESIRSSKARENDNMRSVFFLLNVQLCGTLLITSLYFYVSRDEIEGRGMSALNAAKLTIQREDQRLFQKAQDIKIKMERFSVAERMLEKGVSYMTDAMKQHWFQVMEECATNAISDDVDTSEVQLASSSNSTSQSTSISSSSSMSMANTLSKAPTSKNTYTVTNTQHRANHANPTKYNTSSRSTPSSVDRYTHTSARSTVPESNSVSRLTPSDTQRDTQSSTVYRTAPPRSITESNSVSRPTPSDTQRDTQSSTVHRTAPPRSITESNSVSRLTPSDTQRDTQSSTVQRTAPPRTITESNSVSRPTPSDTQRDTQSSVHPNAGMSSFEEEELD
jgi:hypothetical protein